MTHKLYVILTISLICSNCIFSQEPTKKIAFDIYFSPTLSQTTANFTSYTYYRSIPQYTNEIKLVPDFFLSNYGFTVNFQTPKRLTFGIGLALLKRGGREESSIEIKIPTLVDSSNICKESNVTWRYNCLDFPISVEFLLSQTPRLTKSIKGSISISYILDLRAKSKGVFFNDSSYIHKEKWDINPAFKDRLGFSFECGYRCKIIFVSKTSFWFEPYINYLISNTRKNMTGGYLNMGMHLGIQIY